jgi:type II restriction/modification system DNA methylase subunit YeeA
MDFVGRDLFTMSLQNTLHQFEEAENFGSLIRTEFCDCIEILSVLESKKPADQLFLSSTHQKVLQAIRQTNYLSPRYHVVIANPPYMGGKGMNGRLGAWIKDNYPDTKSDLFAAFIERIIGMVPKGGSLGMMTPFTWMFLGSYEKLRNSILSQNTITTLVRPEYHAFFESAYVPICGFTLFRRALPEYRGAYVDLTKFYGAELQPKKTLEAIKTPNCSWLYRSSASDFHKIPGSPIAYWVSGGMRECYLNGLPLKEIAPAKLGMRTGDNDKWLRRWHEVSSVDSKYDALSSEDAKISGRKWFPYNKGGDFRRWYGNNEFVVFWENDGYAIKAETLQKYPQLSWDNLGWKITNEVDFFKPSCTWTFVSSASFGVRASLGGAIFDVGGSSGFPDEANIWAVTGFLCSKLSFEFLKLANPTLNFQVANVNALPWIEPNCRNELSNTVNELVKISKIDWDAYENSWDFKSLALFHPNFHQSTIETTFQKLRSHWREMTLKMQRLEEENNRIFIEAYGLQDELSPEVPLNEITLTCNPHYRYGGNKTEDQLEALLLADTMREFISYAVGCMFGRYALEKPGLILANQGETLADFIRKVGSGKWVVDSNGEENGKSSELSGTHRLAESDGPGGNGLSGNEAFSEGRALRVNESGQAFSGFDSLQYRGRPGQKIESGVSEFLVHCKRFQSGNGDPNPACPALELCNERYFAADPQPITGSKPTTERPNEQPEITAHYPLPTTHYPLLTTHCPLSTIHFLPDDDNVIPMLDGDWFTDDISERFRKFLRVTFGEEHYEENLQFIETAIGKDIRKFFLKDFYNDHIKRYKKRPIYWLFSSPKGSFNALIYMHRYRPDTVNVVLNDYLREFRTKLVAHKDHLEAVSISDSATRGEKTKALKEIEKVKKMIAEMEDYERDILYPLATEQIQIDLDDGVKVNYPKFGAALKKISGLSPN